eukprot:366756_1
MRPSSNWRTQITDGIDIFGNRKRGGGGDPNTTNQDTKVLNASMIKHNKYTGNVSAQNTNQPTSIISGVPPHLKIKLFRQQSEKLFADTQNQKYLQKMKEIEQEKYFQAIYEKELEDLHSKHANKMNN